MNRLQVQSQYLSRAVLAVAIASLFIACSDDQSRRRPADGPQMSSGGLDAAVEGDAPVDAICVPGPVTLAVVQHATSTNASGEPVYQCHDPYLATYTVTNHSCATVTVTQASITGTTSVATCTPAGTSTYPQVPHVLASIAPGQTAVAFELIGGHFCCKTSPCGAALECAEAFSFQLTTSAGVLTAAAQNAEIKLAADCANELCP